MNRFKQEIQKATGNELTSQDLTTFQVNVGLKCNQACVHCHVGSSPQRTEMMRWDTMRHILNAVDQSQCRFVDITGGAPELNPHFTRFISELRSRDITVQVRTNFTALTIFSWLRRCLVIWRKMSKNSEGKGYTKRVLRYCGC